MGRHPSSCRSSNRTARPYTNTSIILHYWSNPPWLAFNFCHHPLSRNFDLETMVYLRHCPLHVHCICSIHSAPSCTSHRTCTWNYKSVLPKQILAQHQRTVHLRRTCSTIYTALERFSSIFTLTCTFCLRFVRSVQKQTHDKTCKIPNKKRSVCRPYAPLWKRKSQQAICKRKQNTCGTWRWRHRLSTLLFRSSTRRIRHSCRSCCQHWSSNRFTSITSYRRTRQVLPSNSVFDSRSCARVYY